MIEMEMFVLNGTILQNKMSPIECQSQNIFSTENWWISLTKSGVIGGPLRNRSDFNQALSTLNRFHRESGGQQLRPMPYWKCQQRQSSSSSFPFGGNGVDPGGLPKNSKKVNKKGCMQRLKVERGNPLSAELWQKPSDEWLSRIYSILLQIDRLQLTAVCCNRRVCKDNTSKDPFSQCEQIQRIARNSHTGKK